MSEAEEKSIELIVRMQFQKKPLMYDQAVYCALITAETAFNASVDSASEPFWSEVLDILKEKYETSKN